ncbi:MAG: S9 family peptidase [Propioniciclava sp.]|uniref:S9 family peptidase n=1 Tax=Propioniciclava sp. TaxID=2038686 RepID=UPI0039E229E6
MRPEHLPLLVTVGAPTVHPEGAFALVAASRASFEADDYTSQLWRVPIAGGTPRRLTRGFADSAPRISPDGRLVAFLRREPDARAQLFVAPAEGGEAAQASDAKLGVSEFCWSPDSRTLAFVARVPEDGRYGTWEGVGAGQEDARRITGNQFQANGLGWSRDRAKQLFIVAAPDPWDEPPIKPIGRAARATGTATSGIAAASAWKVPPARQLTDGPWDVGQPVFTPDGGQIVVTSRRGDDADDHLRSALHRVDLTTGERAVALADARVSFSSACYSGDGTLFALGEDLGTDGLQFVATNDALYVVRDGAPVRLTDPETVELTGPLAIAGEDAVLAVRAHRGGAEVLRVDTAGAVRTVHAGTPAALAVASVPGTGAVVASVLPADSAGEVALIADGAARTLTDFGAALRDQTTIVPASELTATAPDGYPVHGWVWVPQGDGPHPVLLAIHGGPYSHYGPEFFDEFQTYTAAGYAVVACNPRGSASYGQAHGAAITGDFGTLDTADVLAFLDHALATVEGLDAGRVGIQGGSYGGYLTAWIIAHHHRFAGAIVERGFLDPASFLGSSDIGWFFMPAYNGRDRASQDRQSPMLVAGQVRTPTLVVHSEDDLRCPIAQGLRYYAELKASGVPTELLVFPGETHELSRSGTPWHRRQRFEAILQWWARHLPVGGAGAGG